jgi:hypothetical protein
VGSDYRDAIRFVFEETILAADHVAGRDAAGERGMLAALALRRSVGIPSLTYQANLPEA